MAWLTGNTPPQSDEPYVDPLALDVAHRQRRVAQRLAAVTGKSPEELLERRADSLRRGANRAARRLPR